MPKSIFKCKRCNDWVQDHMTFAKLQSMNAKHDAAATEKKRLHRQFEANVSNVPVRQNR